MNDLINFEALYTEPAKQAAQICTINLGDLWTTLAVHPALVAFVVASYESARISEARTKAELERTRARQYTRIVEEQPKLAAGKVEMQVESTEAVEHAYNDWLDAAAKTAALKAVVTGLEHRKDMLVQIASRQKQEMKA